MPARLCVGCWTSWSRRASRSSAWIRPHPIRLMLRNRNRFDFVHDPDLRPVLEQAFVESRSALEKGSCRSGAEDDVRDSLKRLSRMPSTLD